MIDTHAHVHDPAFDPDRDEVLARAADAGISKIITVGTDLADSRRALAVAASSGLAATIGIHPHEAKDAPPDIAAAFDQLLEEGERPGSTTITCIARPRINCECSTNSSPTPVPCDFRSSIISGKRSTISSRRCGAAGQARSRASSIASPVLPSRRRG